jgi:hypothetical protein
MGCVRYGLWGSLLVLAACGGHQSKAGYTADLRKSFVEDCTTTEVPSRLCGCFFDGLADDLPFDQFVLLDAKLADPSAEIPAEVADIVAACDTEQRYAHDA